MTRIWKPLLSLGALGLLVASCGSSAPSYGPVAEPPVHLGDLSALTRPLTLGLVVTSAEGAVGSQDYPLSAGAQVAAFRLSSGRHSVRLLVENDDGTQSGGVAAVRILLRDHVSGIVYASDGPQVVAGSAEAAKAGTPVLLPYQTATGGLPKGAWLTGPDNSEVSSILARYEASSTDGPPIVISETGVGQPSYKGPAASTVEIANDEPAAQVSTAVDAAITSLGSPSQLSAVVLATSDISAAVARALESQEVTTIVLGPDALAPNFGDQLSSTVTNSANAGTATAQATFVAVGEDAYDAQATYGIAAFRSSLRLMAYSVFTTSVFQPKLCFNTEGSVTADTRSQDAVIALAKAAEVAHSTKASALEAELEKGLKVTDADGLAGPDLDFSTRDALGTAGVSMLEATTETDDSRLGLGSSCAGGLTATPGFGMPSLQWFAITRSPR
jgi:hypothetical protein